MAELSEHVKNVCKIGQGNDCCRYLVLGAEGFECAKCQMKDTPNIEKFLIKKQFTIDVHNCDTKVYRRNITDYQTLYVMIFADANKLVSVDYEDMEGDIIDDLPRTVMLETVNSFERLKKLIKAIF